MAAGKTSKGTRFRAPFSVYVDAKGTLVEIVDEDGVIQGTLPDAPTGDVVVATTKTLTVTDADALLVGGLIVPQTFIVDFRIPAGSAAGDYAGSIVIPVAAKIVNVKERHETAGNDAGAVTLMVKKTPSGTARAAGTDCLAAGTSLKATADTNLTPALHATAANYTFAAGDAVSLVLTGTPTAVVGVGVSIQFQRV